MKICTICNEAKELNQFHKNKQLSDGLRNQCIKCNNKRQIATFYGLTIDEYNDLMKRQNYLCAICEQPETRKTASGETANLVIDHDHTFGHVRAALCHKCNTAYGLLNENAELMRKMIEYRQKTFVFRWINA